MNNILSPFKLKKNVTLSNHIVMSPMTTYSSPNGFVTEEQIQYYGLRNTVGMQIVESAYIIESGKCFENSLSVASDKCIPGLSRLASAIKNNGSKAILQIFNAGRLTNANMNNGSRTVSASSIRLNNKYQVPHTLSDFEIRNMIFSFGEAVRRAIMAGFDGIELHGANMFILQQFFSPHSNQRSDIWGGTLKNRMNFPLSVIKKCHDIKKMYGTEEFIIGYSLSPEEPQTPGIRLDDTLLLIEKIIQTNNIDYIRTSTKHYEQKPFNIAKDIKTPVNDQIRKIINNEIPLIVGGGIINPDDAEQALKDKNTLVSIGKALIIDPYWIEKIKNKDPQKINYNLKTDSTNTLKIPINLIEELKKYNI